MPKKKVSVFQRWGDKIGWKQRVKAVCKPCWELKYCPYGPIVEDFPLSEVRDERSCRIFGHNCPVFTVAEPLTETRALRNIRREIPRPIQFRVLKRDNQICGICEKPVLDADIHFDHIIPWSKGGPTEEHNIRLLCGECNRKRGANFESEYLVSSFRDHVIDPVGADFVKMLWMFVTDAHKWRARTGHFPDASETCRIVGCQKKTAFEDRMAEVVTDLQTLFTGKPPSELNGKTFHALADRWGFGQSSNCAKLATTARADHIELDALIIAEMALVRRLRWPRKGHSCRARKMDPHVAGVPRSSEARAG